MSFQFFIMDFVFVAVLLQIELRYVDYFDFFFQRRKKTAGMWG